MTALIKVLADVVDLRRDTPLASDEYLVDTNVWFWQTYTKASLTASAYQTAEYPPYLKAALSVGAKLRRCGLSLAELAHRIEDQEYKVYKATAAAATCTPKEYRHNFTAERAAVVSEVATAWGQVMTMAGPMDLIVDERATEDALLRLSQQPLNGYDLYLADLLSNSGVERIITDDGDFAGVPGIQVFTANRNVIRAATLQNRLITR